MAYEQRDNSGSIFRNDKKEKDTHPDGKGSAMIDGVEYWISSWNKTASNGTQFRSLSFQRKEQQAPAPKQDKAGQWKAGAQKATKYAPPEDDGDIPFRDALSYRGVHLVV